MTQVDTQSVQWLRGLRWIDRADRAWLIAMPTALCVWTLALWPSLGWPEALPTTISHLALAACALACAPRGRLHVWCGLVLLSQLHFLIFAAMQYHRVDLLGWAYLVIATSAILASAVFQLQCAKRFRAALEATEREHYRWLVTQAPLPWRIHFARRLRLENV